VDSSVLVGENYDARSAEIRQLALSGDPNSVVGRLGRAGAPPRLRGMAAKAAVAASLTGLAFAGITAPGLETADPFGRSLSSSVRYWGIQVDEEPVGLSWADVVAVSTEEFLAIEEKRAALANREAMLYGDYEFDDEDWMA
jgi:hypothetical protein